MKQDNMSTKARILSLLNEQQKIPVINYHGASFVIAAPGSGKTTTITSRSQYMIEDGVNPENILMFTFTKKAATEMKERVERKVGTRASLLTVKTYHAFCGLQLRKYAPYIGFNKNFSIYDTQDRSELLKPMAKECNIPFELVSSKISEWKEKLMTPTDAANSANSDIESTCADIYSVYKCRLTDLNAMDFDDLIYNFVKVLEKYKEVRDEVNARYKYIIADEAQDSSPRDLRLLELMAGEAFNLCCVADDEQAIFGFRGSDVYAVMDFIEQHGMTVYELGQNYRSSQNIFYAARSLISNNTMQLDKDPFTENPEGEKVIYFECPNNQDEARRVVKTILTLHNKRNVPLKEIAVLYRISYLSRALEEMFLKNGIKYDVVGGTPFYSRKEIKDILSYIRFINNPFDILAFQRAITAPKRGIGTANMDKIIVHIAELNKLNSPEACIDDTNYSIMDLLNSLEVWSKVNMKGKAMAGLLDFISSIRKLSDAIEENDPAAIIKDLLKHIKYEDYLEKTYKEDYEDRIKNVEELIEISSMFLDMQEFLHNMMLTSDISSENEIDQDNDKVSLMTMHSSKGLEFKVVLIIGANEGVSPHHRASTIKEIEEERRLFYVAMTRAEDYLLILRPKLSTINGILCTQTESRFLKEIDEKYLISAG